MSAANMCVNWSNNKLKLIHNTKLLGMPGRRSVLRRQREEVEKEFECPICQETDRELRIFPACQHFACTECVGM